MQFSRRQLEESLSQRKTFLDGQILKRQFKKKKLGIMKMKGSSNNENKRQYNENKRQLKIGYNANKRQLGIMKIKEKKKIGYNENKRQFK